MKIAVKIESANLIRKLRNGDRRLAYAVVNALNKTGLRIQEAMREKVVGDFTVRQKTFIVRQVAKIDRTNFANVRRGQAWIEIAVGQAPRLLLAKFEAGGERLPFVGKNIAIPVIGGPARPTLVRKVPKQWTFEALNFVKTQTRSGKEMIVSRNQRVYIVPGVGVFARVGKRKSKLVYAFVPHMRLDERLEFVKTARRVAGTYFAEEMKRQVAEAVARAS